MKYLLLIYEGEAQWAAHSEPEVQTIYSEYHFAFSEGSRSMRLRLVLRKLHQEQVAAR